MKKLIEQINSNLNTTNESGEKVFLDSNDVITQKAYLNFACRVFNNSELIESFKLAIENQNEVNLLTPEEIKQAYPVLALLEVKAGVDHNIKFTGISEAKESFLYLQDSLFRNIDANINQCITEGRLKAENHKGFKKLLEEARDRFIPSLFVSGKEALQEESRVAKQEKKKSDVDQLLEIFGEIKGTTSAVSEQDKAKTLGLLQKLQKEVKNDTATGRWLKQACRELEGKELTLTESMKDYAKIAGENIMSFLAFLLNAIFEHDFFKKNPSYEISDDLKGKLTQLQSDFKEVKGKFTQQVSLESHQTSSISAA